MRRREFITLISGAAAWPLAARAQQPALPVIGYLNSGSADAHADVTAAFRQGLAQASYLEGRNVAVEYRWAEGRSDRLPELAADLVRRRVALIVAVGGSAPAQAAKAVTATIPIVFVSGDDPIEAGLVASLGRPGGNVTGISWLASAFEAKRLGLLRECRGARQPDLSRTLRSRALRAFPFAPQPSRDVLSFKPIWRGPDPYGESYMRRREFIILLGGAAAAWPIGARAQQRRVIGFLSSSSPEPFAPFTAAFRHGLERAGYVEGKDVAIEFRWAQGKYDRLAELAVELVRRNVDVIVTHGTPGTYAAMQATTATPIVMAISGDAVATGIITSLARPDANVTGSTFFLPKLNAKRLELFKEAFPRIARVAALSNPDNPVSRPIIPAMKLAAASLKIALEVSKAQGPSEFETAFTAMARSRVEAVVVTEDGEFASSFRSIAALAADNKLPSIGSKEFAEAGGLIGYGANLLELYRRAAYFVDRILKGAKPADLAIEQPTKFELVVNLKTAKALGLDIPPMLLARADKVID